MSFTDTKLWSEYRISSLFFPKIPNTDPNIDPIPSTDQPVRPLLKPLKKLCNSIAQESFYNLNVFAENLFCNFAEMRDNDKLVIMFYFSTKISNKFLKIAKHGRLRLNLNFGSADLWAFVILVLDHNALIHIIESPL